MTRAMDWSAFVRHADQDKPAAEVRESCGVPTTNAAREIESCVRERLLFPTHRRLSGSPNGSLGRKVMVMLLRSATAPSAVRRL
jgi:hypothetical protein